MVGSLILRTNKMIPMRVLHGKVNFDKVIKMVDDMVTLLCKEQVDDDFKKDTCEISIDKAADDMQRSPSQIWRSPWKTSRERL
jgi:hypothetical protein